MGIFKAFQTETATLKKVTTDGSGDETVSESFTVNIDPVFGFNRIHTKENEEITGQSTIITSSSLESDFDLTHRQWKLEFNGHEYDVKQPMPLYEVGTNNLQHIEVTLT